MNTDWMQILTWAVMIAIVVYMLWQSNKPPTAAGISATAKEAAPLATELATVAQMGVMAAEEYMRTGKLASNDEALRFAITFVKRWLPVTRGFTDDDILTAIHSFVPLANALTQQLKAAKTTPPVIPPNQIPGRVP